MGERAFAVFITTLVIISLAVFGCKGKVEKPVEGSGLEDTGIETPSETVVTTQEPAQSVAVETIPPTAQPQIAERPAVKEKGDRSRDIQTALKNAGFYTGAIDGKIGPKTKSAISEFQKAKGLVADGKVGPKTWAELEKYLSQ